MLLPEQIGLVRTNYIQGFCYSLDYFDYYEFLSTYYVKKTQVYLMRKSGAPTNTPATKNNSLDNVLTVIVW